MEEKRELETVGVRFNGREQDFENNYFAMGARQYDSETGYYRAWSNTRAIKFQWDIYEYTNEVKLNK
jgi:hypothetical protein